jgi:hypothetical protein
MRSVFLLLLAAATSAGAQQAVPPTLPPPITVVPQPKPASPPAPVPTTRVLARPAKDTTCSPRTQSPVSEVHAGGGSDRVWAGDQPGRLFGDADDDMLAGGPADDEIHGGTGADILVGGAGSDLFVLDSVDDSPTDENGEWSPLSGDTVVDFTTPDFDKFDVRPLSLAGDAAPLHLRWSGRRPGAYAVWTMPRAGDTVFLIDVDGNSVADIAVRLIGTITLDEMDFCGVVRGAQ